MPHYHIWDLANGQAESFWIRAESEAEARRLVAASAPVAGNATDPEAFGCEVSTTKTPPEGVIYRRINGPILVARETR